MAFIEPRLIHLLNDSTTPQPAHADLPSFRLTFPRPSERPLPLEPGASHREDNSGTASLATSHGAPLPAPGAVDEAYSTKESRKDGEIAGDRNSVGNIASFPLRLLLGDTEAAESSYSLSKILDETPDLNDDAATKKRHRTLTTKDDFVQLPQPVKKQKATQQQVMPPIINGLHEPPPDAALFPPIASSEFNEPPPDNAQLKPIRDFTHVQELVPENIPSQPASPPKTHKASSGKTRKKAMKPRRKWSESETTHLLLGVNRHGVGKWTDILADADFNFNNRTAGDLKDRFRTCCPNELRSSTNNQNGTPIELPMPLPVAEPKTKAKTGLLSENILIDQEEQMAEEQLPALQNDSDSGPKTKRTRAHRKKIEDLVELGIHGPFKKSHRRERRPFSEQDDKQILDGLELYGPAWTKIQRDPRFSLSGRQPTDLRDRVRNKYPSVYQRIEKGLFTVKDSRGNDTLEPSVSMTIGNSFQPSMPSYLDPQLMRVNSREELPRWPLSVLDNGEFPAVSQPFDFGESTNAPFMGNAGEMDISRLLLDDSQITHTSPRYYGPDTASDSVSP